MNMFITKVVVVTGCKITIDLYDLIDKTFPDELEKVYQMRYLR